MKYRFLILFAFIPLLNLKAQDAQFSQFYSSPLYLSPSFTGSTGGSRFVLNYRDQWPSVPGSYVTYSFSADHYLKQYRSGIGMVFYSDQAGGGKLTTTNIGMLYSYKISVSDKFYLQPGLSAYYYSRRINNSKLNFADQFFEDQFIGSTTETDLNYHVEHADFAVSCLGYSANYWLGFTLDHLMKLSSVLNTDTRYTPMRFSLYGGLKYDIKRRVRRKSADYIHVAFNFRNQNKVNQLDLGAYYFNNPLIFGLWYRGIPIGNKYSTSDALIYLIGIKTKRYTFSYSYDMTLGQLISKTGGSHEIAIIFSFNNQNRLMLNKRHRAIPCPEF